jgi:diadenosine tetraphosphatase ApaH/serine/threonine PP2A family protein phosphatase
MRVIGTPHLVVGHTHEPRIARFPRRRQPGGSTIIQIRENDGYAFDTGRFVINPGSVGQPRDGDPRASYAVLGLPGSGSDAITVTHRRVAYDVSAIQSEMMRVRLPLEMATRLSFGE